MFRAQVVERRVAANFEIGVEMDARLAQSFDAAHYHILFKLEAGNAVSHQPASAVVTVVYMDLVTGDAQVFGCCQTAGASTDDTDRHAKRGADCDGFNPTHFPCGVGDIFFNRADGNRIVARELYDAIAFAQPVLRTNSAADFGHGRGKVRQLIGFTQSALRC